ncbi:MAG TPA: carboxypeptidase regulatory-like domain-containing protein, partial [Luteitalea sp.]|nr:carboxypeptidase regulatory-like domain-containing protein [Luteitalea sp.]
MATARLIFVWVFLLLCATPSWAQFETGSITGTVTDNSGGALPGATVTLRNLATNVTQVTVTNDSGAYEFFTLRVGRYEVKVELSGFTSATLPDVALAIGNRQRVDVSLNVGALSESVEVQAQGVSLERDSSQRSSVVTAEQAVALPLPGREYSALVQLSPGVRRSQINNTQGTGREGSFTINGLRSTYNNYLLDGIDNNAYGTSNQGYSNQVIQPPPDALVEMRVVTNNMSAEYGRSGGGTVNVAYKSGSNRFSGSGWEYRRDPSLNATGFFKPAAGTEPKLTRDQFGFVFGGPILRNRAFFFTDYEGLRQDRSTVAISSIPDMTQRQGILAVATRDPRTGTVYPAGTALPMTDAARKILNELPTPTSSGTANNYRATVLATNDTDKFNIKLDEKLSDRLTLFGRYGWRDTEIVEEAGLPLPSGGAGNGFTYVKNKALALGATYMPGGTQLLEFRFGWSTTEAGKNPPALGSTSAFDAYGIGGLPSDPRVAGGLPTLTITGFTALGRQATNPQWQYPDVWNPKINYSVVKGRQSFKIGYEFQRINTQVQDVNPLYGTNIFAGQFTRPTGIAANNIYNLSDFMLGYQSQYTLSNILVANIRQNMQFAYIQDDIRVNDKLTLNVGLRYEYATPHWEKDNILSNFDPASLTMVAARDGSLEDRTTIAPDRNNFGPRVGLAYSLTPTTVLRGGYGTSYVHFQRAGGANILPINGPQVINAVSVQNDPNAASFQMYQSGFPAGWTDPSRFNPAAANVTYMPRDYRSSRVDSWFVSAQKEIIPGTIVDVAYVGNRAEGLLQLANYNQGRPNAPGENTPLQARRPIQGFGDITYAGNGGRSDYRGFQLKTETRRSGFYFVNALTFSRSRDNGAGSLENANGNSPGIQDFNNPEADFGRSGYDQPFNWTSSLVWDVPVGRGRTYMTNASALTDALLGGWQMAFISFVVSGDPVTFVYTPAALAQVSGITQDFRGANNYRPNLNGDPYGDRNSITSYFNRDAVTIPDTSTPFGNAPRNNVRGPNQWTVDFALQKRFRLPVGTNTNLEVRAEAFNLLNRTNFNAP